MHIYLYPCMYAYAAICQEKSAYVAARAQISDAYIYIAMRAYV